MPTSNCEIPAVDTNAKLAKWIFEVESVNQCSMFVGWIIFAWILVFRWVNANNLLPVGPSPNVVVTLFAKNEGILLQYWIDYYSRLFSPKQLLILDNYSTDNKTLDILHNSTKLGVKVLYNQGPYRHKGMSELVAARKHFPRAEIFIPIDCDEFIVAVDRAGYPYSSADDVRNHVAHFQFERHSTNITCLGFEQQFDVLSTSLTKSFWQETQYYLSNVSFEMSKKIFHLHDTVSVDLGHHHGKLRNGTTCASALGRLGIVHYHNRGPWETLSRALIDVVGFEYLPPDTTLANLNLHRQALEEVVKMRRPGRHKAKELLLYLDQGPESLLTMDKRNNFITFHSLSKLVASTNTAALASYLV